MENYTGFEKQVPLVPLKGTPFVQEKKKSSKKKIVLLILITFILVIAASAAVGFAVLRSWMDGKINHKELDRTPGALGINAVYQDKKYDGIVNIALFGIDARGGDTGRSDSIMILSVDRKRHKVKVTSLMRDSYVNIEGHGNTKLGHAYAYGGAPLAMKTVNQNYNLNIRDYVTVNFDTLAQIIDAVGGVTINISDDERKSANDSIKEYANVYHKDPTYIQKGGEQVLNGMQAVGYARIRYVGNSDYERTERQRKVLEQIFDKVLKSNPLQYPKLLSTILPLMETSLKADDILKLGVSIMISGPQKIEQARFPLDEDVDHKKSTINGVSYVVFDLKTTSNKLGQYIFDDVDPSQDN